MRHDEYSSDLGIMEELREGLGETGAMILVGGFWFAVAVAAVIALCIWVSHLGRDSDPILLPRRRVRMPVWRILHEWRLRVPWMVYWPFFGRLYAGTHALILASSGGGKGVTVLLPALAHHVIHWCRGRALRHLTILDPKAELLAWLVPLLNLRGWGYYVYSMLPEHPTSSAVNVVADLAKARSASLALWPPADGTEGHFHRKTRELFLPACEYTGYAGLWQVRELTRDVEVLEAAAETHPALRRAYTQIEPKERSHVLSTLSGALSTLDDPVVRRVFAPDADTEQPDYGSRERPCASVVCMDPDQGAELAPLVEVLLATLYGRMLAAGKPAAGRKSGPGSYSYLDEAASILRLPKLVSWLAVGRGYRTYTAVCAQDLSQIIGKLGRPDAMSAANNARIKLFGQSEDPETMSYAEQISGKVRAPKEPDAPAAERWKNTVPRSRLMGEHLQDFDYGTFFARSQTVRRPREVATMPHPDGYWPTLLRRLEAKRWSYRPRGVPRSQREELLKRLVVGDPELEASEWTDPRIRRAAAKAVREGWRDKLLVSAGTAGEANAQSPPAPSEPEPTVPTFDRRSIPNLRPMQKVCTYCGHSNPATAEMCEMGCDAPLAVEATRAGSAASSSSVPASSPSAEILPPS